MSQSSDHSLIQPDRGLDRKQLKTVKQNFLQVNQSRLDRALASLNERQRQFITSLPIFFHTNHPMLPGFVSRSTPKGVANFSPSAKALIQARQFAHSFAYQKRGDENHAIDALFLMGSSGTIAQSKESDFDVWVCHEKCLSSTQKKALQQRCHKLTQFAQSMMQLEVNFFLMNDKEFKEGNSGELSADDCGSAQHILLLDEFYRTALLLAGKLPIWWLVPPDRAESYESISEQLVSKRYIANDITLDFGDVNKIPIGEFIGAGIWQLYKGIHRPYKSVLKLTAIEAYASEHPNTVSLSQCYKIAIDNHQLNIDELDPYIMLYRKIEAYLTKKNDLSRLDLIRHCLYLKIGIKLSRYLPPIPNSPQHDWRVNAVSQLTKEWGWNKSVISQLDQRDNWKIQQVTEERNALVGALMNSYRFLSQFAKQHEPASSSSGKNHQEAIINKQELTILGRNLYAVFERRAGKVEKTNLGISQNISEPVVTFIEETTNSGGSSWGLYDDAPQKNALFKQQALKQAGDIISLLAWACFNGIIDLATKLHIESPQLAPSSYELEKLKKKLLKNLNEKQLSLDTDSTAFSAPAQPKTTLLIINLGLAPMPQLQEKGVHRLSSHADALSYGGLKENLIHSIDQIDINSWNEVTTAHFDGDHCLIDCLKNQLQVAPPAKVRPPNIKVLCYSLSHANTIMQRVSDIFSALHKHCYLNAIATFSRCIFKVRDQYALIQYQGKSGVKTDIADNKEQLFKLLSAPQHAFSPILIDSLCDTGDLFNTIAAMNQPNSIQVFIMQEHETNRSLASEKCYRLFIFDENGSLFHDTVQAQSISSIVKPLHIFIQSCQSRQQNHFDGLHNDIEIQTLMGQEIALYLVEYRHSNGNREDFTIEDYLLTTAQQDHPVFSIQAIAERNHEGSIVFHLFCDYHEFNALSHGDLVYQKAAEFILSKRESNTAYPCYITDLDLSRAIDTRASEKIQTVQYLEYKALLEARIYQAMLKLSKGD